MLVVTTNDLTGYRVVELRGLVIGVAARPRNKFTEGIRPLKAGNPHVGEAYLAAGRHEAVERMAAHARACGGNAVLNMRFDHRNVSEMWMEICAYGTCVLAEPLPSLSRRQRSRWGLRNRAAPRSLPAGGVAVDQVAPDQVPGEAARAVRGRLP
jgi:uncharacterized protein YbjQ (UPF0145 family)